MSVCTYNIGTCRETNEYYAIQATICTIVVHIHSNIECSYTSPSPPSKLLGISLLGTRCTSRQLEAWTSSSTMLKQLTKASRSWALLHSKSRLPSLVRRLKHRSSMTEAFSTRLRAVVCFPTSTYRMCASGTWCNFPNFGPTSPAWLGFFRIVSVRHEMADSTNRSRTVLGRPLLPWATTSTPGSRSCCMAAERTISSLGDRSRRRWRFDPPPRASNAGAGPGPPPPLPPLPE
mmetsp:Transcript_23071/g.66598  ORF Transcript_23071/g.66598 Transcript_23071/m.66598 type:complete len:233 (+) Transcript_23071:958-1656(+)